MVIVCIHTIFYLEGHHMLRFNIILLMALCLLFIASAQADLNVDCNQNKQLTSKKISSTQATELISEKSNSKPTQNLQSLVEGFYQGKNLASFWSYNPEESSSLRSQHLSELFTQNIKKHEELFLGFDPFVNGQDALITEISVKTIYILNQHAIVMATFKNFDSDNTLLYSFVMENEQWKLDEISSVTGDSRWMLTNVLINP